MAAAIGLGCTGQSTPQTRTSAGLGWSDLKPPYVISHRGAPPLFVEHSLYGYAQTVRLGSPFVEVDCFLLADGSLGVMHDDTLERTTTTAGETAAQTAASWRLLRFKTPRPGIDFDPEELGPPLLEDVLSLYGNRVILLVEAKNKGSGAAIVAALKRHGVGPDFVLVNSFSEEELEPARGAGYPAALSIFHEKNAPPIAEIAAKNYRFVILWHRGSDEFLSRVRMAGIQVLGYGVTRRYEADRLLRRGAVGFLSHQALYISGAVRQPRDSFGQQRFFPGQLPIVGEDIGRFTTGGRWGLAAASPRRHLGVLQGWCSPLGGARGYQEMSIRFNIEIRSSGPGNGSVGVVLSADDRQLDDGTRLYSQLRGYRFLVDAQGLMRIERHDGDGDARTIATTSSPPLPKNQTVELGITYRSGRLEFWRFSSRTKLSAQVKETPGAFVTFVVDSLDADFSEVLTFAL